MMSLNSRAKSWRASAPNLVLAALVSLAPAVLSGGAAWAQSAQAGQTPSLLVTGKSISPLGTAAAVGSFPTSAILSPDGKYLIVSDSGGLEYLTCIRVADGSIVSQLDENGQSSRFPKGKTGLYFGLACAPNPGGAGSGAKVYAAQGSEGTIAVVNLDAAGNLTDTGKPLSRPNADPPFLAGLALSADHKTLYAADNRPDSSDDAKGSLLALDTTSGKTLWRTPVPGYPYAVTALTSGPVAGQKLYATSEQRGTVAVLDAGSGRLLRQIPTGAQPIALLLDAVQKTLYVANAGSDTVSIVATGTDAVTGTILLRPADSRDLPGATPTGLALSPDENTLYVTLGDMNAVAAVNLPGGDLRGYLPVGWYPTAVAVAPDGHSLLVANAKGEIARSASNINRTKILNILRGSVSRVGLTGLDWPAETLRVLANNAGQTQAAPLPANPGIKHVIYIIKENRTYDQVLGDLPTGNGDPATCLFGQEVTPNQHALAQRFALLDNFYCCAEVSGDGWNWSTGSMASEYTERNVPYSYTGRHRDYDFEGTNGGRAVDVYGIPDAARPPGGYIWDDCDKHGISQRNYGFFTTDYKVPRTKPDEGTPGKHTGATKRVLQGVTDDNFRQFDLTYPDSDAWVQYQLKPKKQEMTAYGRYHSPSRVAEWKREFAVYVKHGNLPQFSMFRLCRDHTSGTKPGVASARAMVADNDYAVGEVVDAVSHSPYWTSTAIVIVEDDAQNGYDHVDVHRSTAYVISPFVERGLHDGHFYNTDSALRTIEWLLGMPPMTQYDSIAPLLDPFGAHPDNAEPYDAILPAKAIIAEHNTNVAYRAADSLRLIKDTSENSAADEQLNDILWRSIKGTTPPARHYGLAVAGSKPKDDDEDGDGD